VYVENHRVAGLDPKDPIRVSYQARVGNEPTGKDNPELLKMHPSHGHDMTIVNGISRIGYMSGGQAARWRDEDMADAITGKATAFIREHRSEPFFLYFATHDIHVPRVPNRRFVDGTPMGPRGDVIAELDWSVGEVLAEIDRQNLAANTLVVFSSDNGPVVDDGYKDQAVERLGDHRPAGPYRGGKYSIFEAGTRIPMMVRWPGRVKPGVSGALVSQVDFLASFGSLIGEKLPQSAGPDSFDVLAALLGESQTGRDHLVEQAGVLSLRQGNWKLILPGKGQRVNRDVNIELGNDPEVQLYDLSGDPGETKNVAGQHPDRVKELTARLAKIRADGRSRL
jgi:arylsulfatase A-like enzyme